MTGSDTLWDLSSELLQLADPSDLRQAAIGGILDALTTRPGERPEDVLLDLKLVDDERLALALAMRSGRPYESLREFTPNGRLFLYVPLPLAQNERVVPLVLVGDSLTIACAFVDADLSYLRDRFPNLVLNLVIAPRRNILAALRRVAL